ncbi:MAG: hypothetical protein IIB00_11470 [candidate division Zixibacteria bacterium]|nr:hypothetical protein [candidate division Zixibacteria bacterium]
MERVDIRRLSLELTRFELSEISVVRFNDVDWPHRSGKVILYDELCNVDPGELKRLYEALLKAHDEARDYSLADEWYFRLQEINRRFGKNNIGRYTARRFPSLSLAGLYKLSSDYGESWLKPIRWLAVLNSLLFPIFYLLIGSIGANYDIALDLRFLIDGEFWGDWIDAVLLGFKSTTLRGLTDDLDPRTVAYRITVSINFLNFVVNAALISLFVISIKRKFRRR